MIAAHKHTCGLHTTMAPPIFATRADDTQSLRVLICVQSEGVRELIRLILADAGYAVAAMDVLCWLIGNPTPEPPPEVLILDAWPLRHADAMLQAQARLAAQPAAVVLLVDSPQLAHLAAKLGAASTLPLLFTLHDLVTAVQQGANTQTRCALAADAVGAWD
jgi:DNA-binding NtrC family response regulator